MGSLLSVHFLGSLKLPPSGVLILKIMMCYGVSCIWELGSVRPCRFLQELLLGDLLVSAGRTGP